MRTVTSEAKPAIRTFMEVSLEAAKPVFESMLLSEKRAHFPTSPPDSDDPLQVNVSGCGAGEPHEA